MIRGALANLSPSQRAVFLDVEVFLSVQEDRYAAFQLRCIEELAGWISAKSVFQASLSGGVTY